jgi:uncharacterized membrane protein HdeD (DUF308 family)
MYSNFMVMSKYNVKNWWILTIKGMLTLSFVTLAMQLPVDSLPMVKSILGILLLIIGIMLVTLSIIQKILKDRAFILTEGFLDIVIGTIMLSFQAFTQEMFISMIAIWISFIGILQIGNKYRLNSLFNHWGFLLFNVLLAIIFAFSLFNMPLQSIVTRVVLIGLQSGILIGFLVVSSCHVRKLLADIRIDIPHKEGEEGNQELTYF